MADPLSITGGLVGLVSLGLQLYGNINSYLNAIESRDKDLASAMDTTSHLRHLLNCIYSAVTRHKHSYPDSISNLAGIANSCEEEIGSLARMIEELKGANPSSSKLLTKKLIYPFRRPDLERLEQRVQSLNTLLSTALGMLSL